MRDLLKALFVCSWRAHAMKTRPMVSGQWEAKCRRCGYFEGHYRA